MNLKMNSCGKCKVVVDVEDLHITEIENNIDYYSKQFKEKYCIPGEGFRVKWCDNIHWFCPVCKTLNDTQ